MPPARSTRLWSLPGFHTVGVLGAGASGEVVEAVTDVKGTPVAIKYLSTAFCSDPAQLAGFRREARVLQQLNSPYITRVYEYQEHSSGAAIVMELVKGPSLAAVLREQAPLTPEAALWLLKGSLRGLSAAHAAGIIHRDYKPANVLIAPDGTSRLVDFGIALRQGTDAPCAGTPAYMAPEQWRGAPPSPATDVYAASATFFECLTGERPFHGSSLQELAVQHTTAPVPDFLAPESVRPLLAQGLAKTPESRIPNADRFLAALEETATAVYGPDWEERGKRVLAALIALVPFALPAAPSRGGGSDAAITGLPAQVPASAKHTSGPLEETDGHPAACPPLATNAAEQRKLWTTAATGAATVAVLVATVVAVSAPDNDQNTVPRGSADASTSALTTSGPQDSAAPSEAADTESADPDDAPHATGDTAGTATEGEMDIAEGVPVSDAAGSEAPDETTSGAPPLDPSAANPMFPADSSAPTAGPSQIGSGGTSPSSPTGPEPNGSPAPPMVEHIGVTGLSADASRKATATVIVRTDGTGPVKLTVRWYDASATSNAAAPGRQEGPAQTQTLAGQTRYVVNLTHIFDLENCAPHWGVLVATAPVPEQARPYRTTLSLPCRASVS